MIIKPGQAQSSPIKPRAGTDRGPGTGSVPTRSLFLSEAHRSRQLVVRLFILILSGLLVTGCAIFNKDKEDVEDKTVEELYSDARESMEKGNWETALGQLRTLEARYPYGKYAIQAQIDTVYIYYRSDQTGLATAAADRFIKLHPTHASVDYIYYLKGLSGFEEDPSLLGRLLGHDDLSDRDAAPMYDALVAFQEVYTRFPDSRYAPDARVRAQHLLDSMARNEIVVAKYYYSKDAHVAVVNRASGVVQDYASTPSVEEALALMMSSYRKMGMNDLSDDARRVLEHNFPDSEYLEQYADIKADNGKAKTGWVSRIMSRFRKPASAEE